MRRGRIQFIKIAIGALIVLAVFYFLFSDSNTHTRAKQAISARFTANKPRERPVFSKTGKSINHNSMNVTLIVRDLFFRLISQS